MTSGGGGMWLDREAGPVVRPYALTRGRTQAQGPVLGLIDLVTATGPGRGDARGLGPEHRRLLDICQRPMAVADIASETDLPLGVVRVLLGDLRERGLIAITGPAAQASAAESVLRSVLDGLRAL
jgi:Protein of unknown function (DUF742)